jgi:hypothetical protein
LVLLAQRGYYVDYADDLRLAIECTEWYLNLPNDENIITDDRFDPEKHEINIEHIIDYLADISTPKGQEIIKDENGDRHLVPKEKRLKKERKKRKKRKKESEKNQNEEDSTIEVEDFICISSDDEKDETQNSHLNKIPKYSDPDDIVEFPEELDGEVIELN